MPKNVIETKTKEPLLQMLPLKNKETQNVEVQKINEIDSKETKRRLEKSKSVYIKLKKKQKSNVNFIVYEG